MAERHTKGSKRKYGLTPGYTPKLLREPTDEAQIPLTQRNGEIRYVSAHDLEWMVTNGKIEAGRGQSK